MLTYLKVVINILLSFNIIMFSGGVNLLDYFCGGCDDHHSRVVFPVEHLMHSHHDGSCHVVGGCEGAEPTAHHRHDPCSGGSDANQENQLPAALEESAHAHQCECHESQRLEFKIRELPNTQKNTFQISVPRLFLPLHSFFLIPDALVLDALVAHHNTPSPFIELPEGILDKTCTLLL